MRFRLKKRGLLADTRESHIMGIREVSVRKSALKSEDTIQIFVKGKKVSGVLELKRDELKNILSLS